MIGVAERQAVEALGGGKYRLECGGPHQYYRRNGLWLLRDFSAADADTPAELTHYFSKGKWALGVNATVGMFRVYPDPGNLFKYIELASPTPLPVTVTAGQGQVEISRYVTVQDTTYKFTFGDSGFKSFITCGTRAKAPNPIKFNFTLSGIVRKDRALSDADTGEFICNLPSPWVEDATGSRYDVVEDITGAVLTMTVQTPQSLVFPIVVDPSLVIQPSTADSYMMAAFPTTNYKSEPLLAIRSASNGRSVLSFDFTSLPGATISSALLTLVIYSVAVGSSINAHRLLRTDWVESEVTWNNYKSGTPWTTAGGDYTATDVATTSVPSVGTYDWDITNQVIYWQATGKIAHVLMKQVSEAGFKSSPARSKEYGTPSQRPKLTIDYTEAAGGGLLVHPGFSGGFSERLSGGFQ